MFVVLKVLKMSLRKQRPRVKNSTYVNSWKRSKTLRSNQNAKCSRIVLFLNDFCYCYKALHAQIELKRILSHCSNLIFKRYINIIAYLKGIQIYNKLI